MATVYVQCRYSDGSSYSGGRGLFGTYGAGISTYDTQVYGSASRDIPTSYRIGIEGYNTSGYNVDRIDVDWCEGSYSQVASGSLSNGKWKAYSFTGNIYISIWYSGSPAPTSHTVSYNKNYSDAEGTVPSSQTTTTSVTLKSTDLHRPATPSTSTYTVTFQNSTGSAGTLTRSGTKTQRRQYSFSQWSINGSLYSAGSSYWPTSNVTAYATYNSYTTDVGSATYSGVTCPDPGIRAGFDFVGWENTTTGGIWAVGSTYYGIESLTAKWSAKPTYNYYLRFNANGGSGAPSTKSATGQYSTSYDFWLDGTQPTRTDYNFLGWSFSSTATYATYSADAKVTLSSSDPDKTLYAVWQEKPKYTYYINYNANGGSGAPPRQSYGPTTNTIHTFILSSTEPTRQGGYYFAGWATTSTGEKEFDPGDTVTNDSSSPTRTLYAVWHKYTDYNVTVESDHSNWIDVSFQNEPTIKHKPFLKPGTARFAALGFNTDLYFIQDWEVNGVSWGTTANYIILSIPRGDVVGRDYTITLKAGKYESSTITLHAGPGGSVSGAGTFRAGTQRTVTATPDDGYEFLGWRDSTGTLVSPLPSYTFILSVQPVELWATFGHIFRKVTLNASPSNGGKVYSRKSDSSEWHEGEYSYWQGSDVVIKAEPTGNYSFQKWDDNSTVAERTIYVGSSDITKTAYFGFKYSIVVGKTAGITVATINDNPTSVSIWAGEKVNLYCEVDPSYRFLGWYDGDDNRITTNTSYTGYEPVKTQTITAKAELNQVSIRLSSTPSEGGYVTASQSSTTPVTSQTYNIGQYFRFYARPNRGYVFDYWEERSSGFTTRNNPPSNRQATKNDTWIAHFKCHIGTDVYPDSHAGAVDGEDDYYYDEKCYLTAYPSELHRFDCWDDGDTSNPKIFRVYGADFYVAKFLRWPNMFVGENRVKAIYLGDIEISSAKFNDQNVYRY